MCPNGVIVHANRWLNRQLPNLHERMEVVHIQKAGGTWTLCKQAAFLKACENLAPGASELHKSQSKLISSCTSGIYSLTSAAMVMIRTLTRSSSGSTMAKGLISAISFCILDSKQKFKLNILLWSMVRNEFWIFQYAHSLKPNLRAGTENQSKLKYHNTMDATW